MISIQNADCGYISKGRKKVIVSDLNFDISPGKCICLMGVNGAGKTTVFRSILGSIPLLAGRISIDGEDVSLLPRMELAKRLAYVPQQHVPPFPYTVAQVVIMGRCAWLDGLSSPKEKDQEITRDVLAKLGIEHLAERNYMELSGGERQMVLIARALVQETEYLLLDEPTSNLDYGNQMKILFLANSLAKAGKGICIIIHNPEHALMLDGECVVLPAAAPGCTGEGEAVLTGRTREVLTAGCISRIYGVKAELNVWTAANHKEVYSVYNGL